MPGNEGAPKRCSRCGRCTAEGRWGTGIAGKELVPDSIAITVIRAFARRRNRPSARAAQRKECRAPVVRQLLPCARYTGYILGLAGTAMRNTMMLLDSHAAPPACKTVEQLSLRHEKLQSAFPMEGSLVELLTTNRVRALHICTPCFHSQIQIFAARERDGVARKRRSSLPCVAISFMGRNRGPQPAGRSLRPGPSFMSQETSCCVCGHRRFGSAGRI